MKDYRTCKATWVCITERGHRELQIIARILMTEYGKVDLLNVSTCCNHESMGVSRISLQMVQQNDATNFPEQNIVSVSWYGICNVLEHFCLCPRSMFTRLLVKHIEALTCNLRLRSLTQIWTKRHQMIHQIIKRPTHHKRRARGASTRPFPEVQAVSLGIHSSHLGAKGSSALAWLGSR